MRAFQRRRPAFDFLQFANRGESAGALLYNGVALVTTRKFGIRIALSAKSSRIARLVLQRSSLIQIPPLIAGAVRISSILTRSATSLAAKRVHRFD